jgi:LysR family transcriptional regulator, low CO2-responsive transcriptional regulator
MTTTLDSRHMLAFATLARCRSFTQTAKELHLTQSAISHTIKALEQDIGVSLFERVGKRVFLTQAGEQLRPAAERILREMNDARASMEEIGAWGRGRLRIGASVTTCQHPLPTVLREFRQSFPDCALRLIAGDGPYMCKLLLENQVDLALMLEPDKEDTLDFRPLFTDELQALVAPMHPWVEAGRVPHADLSRETFIIYHKGSYTYRMVEDYFRAEGIRLSNTMELGSMDAIKELAKVGMGAALMAPWVARKELTERSLVALPLGAKKLCRTWGIAHLRGRVLSLAEETFIGLCEAVVQGLK